MAYPISSDGIIIPDDATGILLYKNAQLVDNSLQSAFGLTVPVNEYEHIVIASNGKAEESYVNNGGVMTVLSGGSAELPQMKNGTLEVLTGGKATNLLLEGNNTIRVIGGEVDGINGTYDAVGQTDSNDYMITDQGIIRNARIRGEASLSNGGILEKGYMTDLRITVNSGGKIQNTTAHSSCTIVINDKGEVNDITFDYSFTSMYVNQGGYASKINIYCAATYFYIGNGGVMEETDNRKGAIYISSGGTAIKTIINTQDDANFLWTAMMHVSEGGLASETQIISGFQIVSGGGTARKTEVRSRGSQIVSNGGIASETMLSDGGRLTVSAGVAKDVHAVRDGAIVVGSHGVAREVILDSYNVMQVSNTGHVEDVEVASGGEVYLLDGAVLGGRLSFENGAVVSAYEGATIDFDISKANATTPLIDNLRMITGAPSYTITVSADMDAGVYLLAAGAADFSGTITVQDDTMRYGTLSMENPLVYGWNTYTLSLNEDTLTLMIARNAVEAPKNGDSIMHETVNNAMIQEGETHAITSGLTYYGAKVNNGGTLNVQNGGKAEESYVNNGGVMTVLSGGSAELPQMKNGTLEVLTGGKATNLLLEGNNTIRVIGGEVDGINGTYDAVGQTDSNDYMITDQGIIRNARIRGEASLSNGGILEKGYMTDLRITVNSGGKIQNTTAHSSCTIVINDKGEVNDITFDYSFTSMYVNQGGYASKINIYCAATYFYIGNGGVMEETDNRKGAIYISSGGTAIKTIINTQDDANFLWTAMMHVSEGGLASETQIISGFQIVSGGGTARKTEVRSRGSQIVSNGGIASETMLSDGGRLTVSAGVAKDVHAVRDGAIVVGSHGVAREVILDSYNVMQVSNTGHVEDVEVASGGEVYLLDGAVLGGRLSFENGAVVSAYEGATIDFDISKANATTPLIDNLRMITGAPSYTITVSADMDAGVYLLAAGAADFSGTITVQDDTMRYGTLSMENPLVYGWNTYTLSLNNDAMTLSITKNDVYHEPETVEPEPEEIIVSSGTEIASGETLVWEKTGDTVRITSGGILNDTEIPWGGTLILEEGAILQGTVRLGTDVLVNGVVDAAGADLELDISRRKEEYGTLLNNLAFVAAATLSVIVDPDQNKGAYVLAGYAQDFNGVLTVKSTDGVNRGTITVEQETLEYQQDHTLYTLTKNEQNELVFIVSSSITDETDYVLLYKNERLVLAKESEFNLTISREDEFDQIQVIDKGVAERIEIGNGGLAHIFAGARLLVSDQKENGLLRFDYVEDDSTVIKGFNQYGAFFVENNLLENVQGEVVNVTGNVLIRNYHGTNRLTTKDGVEVTGTGEGGEYCFHGTRIQDFTMQYDHGSYFYEDTVVRNTEWNNGTLYVGSRDYNVPDDRVLFEHAVFNSYVYLYGGTLSDVAFNSRVYIDDYVSVESNLYFRQRPDYSGNGYFDMHGHTVTMDYTGRKETDSAMISLDCFSEDTVFQLNLNPDQIIGKYAIATEARRGDGTDSGVVNTYHLCVDGNIIGTIDGSHTEFVSGNYIYTMTRENDTELYLTIDFSDSADDVYNVDWYDTERNFYHSASVTGLTISPDLYPQAVVRNRGILGGSKLASGGLLSVRRGGQVIGLDQEENSKLRFDYTEGDSTVVTGANPYGGFIVRNNVMENVYGENITVSGKVAMHNYHGYDLDYSGTLTTNGVSITGTFGGGDYNLYNTSIKDFTLEYAWYFDFYSGTIDDSEFNGGWVYFYGGIISETVMNTYVNLYGGTFSDVEINSGYSLRGNVFLDGDLTLNCAGDFEWDSCINVNGCTVNVNYKDRSLTDGGMFSVSNFSEDANFRLLFREDQKIGTYTIAWNAGSFVDFFLMNIGGVDMEEELSFENPEMDYGNYHYVMSHDVESQLITLSIDISENADETFNLYYWDAAEEEFFHSASVNGLDFSTDGYHDLVVRNHGIVTNSELRSGGIITVKTGGQVIGLDQSEGGKLRFNYAEGDSTVVKGMNQYGAFFVENNLLENVYGEIVSVSGGISINTYHSMDGGTLETSGETKITGTFYGDGYFDFSGALIHDFEIANGSVYLRDGAAVKNASFTVIGWNTITFYDCYVEKTVLTNNGCRPYHPELQLLLCGGTYSEVVVGGEQEMTIGGYVSLDGDLTFRKKCWIDSSPLSDCGIVGNGFTVTLDLTERTVIDSEMLSLNKLYNTELRVVIDQTKPIGTYTLASNASQISQGDGKGVYDWDTNKWLFQGATIGDLDGIISVYDSNGVELANCTVNGDTEYFGRHNYTVFVDEDGYLKLKVGWNNRKDLTFAADEKEENDTIETATVITGRGKDAIPSLTIDSDSDVDWFMFTLETIGRKSSYIGIEFKQWAGDLDINLYNSKGELIDYARSVTDNERLSLSGLAAGTYYLKVSGYNGNRNSYKLVYNLPEPIEFADDYEKGDDKAHSYFLKRLEKTITVNASISRSDDKDFYMFILPERGLVSDVITLTYDDDFGDLDLYLYDQDGKTLLISSTNTVGGQERITLAGLKHGVYYAEVKSKDGSIGQYQLVFDVNNRDITPDKYENNNSIKKATKLYTLNGEKTLDGLSIHSDTDVDYYRFSILEKGSSDDFITLRYVPSLGDLDIEILNADDELVAYSRTAENEDMVSLKGLDVGEYYIRVYGYNNVANNYTLSWHVTNSALIPSDEYEGYEPILIREDQTITGLSIAKVREEDETREDTFKIVLEYDAWKRSKIILTDYRSDWEDGMSYVIKDADGKVLMEGIDSEISLYGLKKGEYYLTLDTPNEDEYSEYSLIAQCLPDSDIAKDNTWSIFIYMAGDNNLEGAFLQELLYMQRAILPENVEVYVLMDRAEGYAVAERNWTDTRVGKIRHSNGGAVAVQWMYFNGADTDTYMNTHNLELQKEWDTGDVKTLEAFLDWGMKEGRANNYALIIKDHGTSLGYNCEDDESGSIMAIKDIAELLKSDKYQDLSVVAFDQCLMGSDVVVTTMEGTVDYVVASEAVGYTPNWLVMYKVLLNSFETEMTPQEVSQKILAACNCSGLLDLTMASFNSDKNTLSGALEQFGELSKQFTFADWVVLCKCFSKVHNYGDEICAYSDLGSILNMIQGYRETISSTLLDAANALCDTVMNTVIDSTMITPDIYGTGLAVFNPIKSDPMMAAYTYGSGSTLDYYATDIGKTAWGEFMYTLSKIADECSDYIVGANGNLTFTSFTYYYEDGEIKTSYDLGAFNGSGVSFEGLYMDHAAYFNVRLEQAGGEGDAIVVTADNPDAEITIELVQMLIPTDAQLLAGAVPYPATRRFENGVLPLAGVDYDKNRAMNNYTLIIRSTEETTYDLKFVGNWTNGVDYFDYSRTGSISSLAAGNNSIDKATQLPNGNYGGLVTCAGDKDYYKILSVYANSIDVTVKGTGLVVQEYNAEGELLQTAVEEDGQYKLTVAKDNYVCVEGSADITADEYNPYTLSISDVAQMYLKAELNAMLPDKPIVTSELKDNQVSITIDVDEGLQAFYSTDMFSWDEYTECLVVTENDNYYFKAVDTRVDTAEGSETKVESKYTLLRVVGIDHVAPTVDNVTADITKPTNGDVTVTAEFADDTQLNAAQYRIGEDVEWLDYVDGVTVSENATVYFRAIDVAGNTSAIVPYDVTNIDRIPPVIELVGDNTMTLQASTLTAMTEPGLDIFYSRDNQTWTKYEGQLEVTSNGTYFFKATDAAGNTGTTEYVFSNILPFTDVIPLTQTWEKVEGAEQYIVEYSTDNIEHVIRLAVNSNSLDSFQMPAGNYQMRIKPEGGEWTELEPIVASEVNTEPKLVKSNEDGNADVFFANAVGAWETGYLAQHAGSINDWGGTNEYTSINGKNKLADIIEGSTDANILLMTDDDNGDALFVDDIYTALPGSVSEQQSRIAQIDEIRAGFGNDIVDMTSQRFEYIGDGLTIRGGAGNDVIWANKGDNWLFGDAGNDRLVGASSNDIIAGGIGNDRMHGGGGDDVFTFCGNWGTDTVEQLATGSVTLWFASGSIENWDKTTLTYTDGDNSVKVSGITVEQVKLMFGDDGSDQFASLSGMGAFFDGTTERIFEESGKGILASL